jgi:drug/metabolite transporter (DMT)-like permease
MNSQSDFPIPNAIVGTSAMLCATVLMAVMGLLVKFLHIMELDIFVILAVRSLIVAAILAPALAFAAPHRAVARAGKRLHFLHAALTLGSMLCFYYSLRFLPLVTVTTINFTMPLFVTLLAVPLLGERIHQWSAVAISIGFLGALIVMRPDTTAFNMYGFIALFGAFLGSCVVITLRRMPVSSSNYAVLFYPAMTGSFIYFVLAVPRWESPTAEAWPLLIVLAGIAVFLQYFLALAFRRSSSTMITGLDYIRLLWAGGLGYSFLEEIPDRIDGIGMALIVISGLVIIVRESRVRRIRPVIT